MVQGFVIAAFAFVAAFIMHIIGGQTDTAWLFVAAVGLIFVSAAGFPAIVVAASSRRARRDHMRVLIIGGSIVGVILTSAALWAAADRTFTVLTVPGALVAVFLVSSALWIILRQPVTFRRAVKAKAPVPPTREQVQRTLSK